MSVLEIRNARMQFGQRLVLNNVNLTCNSNEIIGIFGRNGAGKSTFLQIIFGTLKAKSIEIIIDSQPFLQNQIIPSQKIAYLPQHPFLPKGLKVRETIPLFFPNGEDQDKIFYSPKVSAFENIQIGKLSLGQLRYLELLLIGNLEHNFLMLDEPFSMVEPLYKEVIKNLLLDHKKTKGIILTDHYYNDVLEITDKNYLINDGNFIKIKDIDDLIDFNYLVKLLS